MTHEELIEEPKPFTSPRRKKNKELKKSGEESSKPSGKSKSKNSEEVTKSSEDTAKSSNKPQLKIVRNNLGSLIIAFFGVLGDVVLLRIFNHSCTNSNFFLCSTFSLTPRITRTSSGC